MHEIMSKMLLFFWLRIPTNTFNSARNGFVLENSALLNSFQYNPRSGRSMLPSSMQLNSSASLTSFSVQPWLQYGTTLTQCSTALAPIQSPLAVVQYNSHRFTAVQHFHLCSTAALASHHHAHLCRVPRCKVKRC